MFWLFARKKLPEKDSEDGGLKLALWKAFGRADVFEKVNCCSCLSLPLSYNFRCLCTMFSYYPCVL